MSFDVTDALLTATKAMPAGAGTIRTDPLDLGEMTDRGERLADCELVIRAPALTAAELPAGQSLAYSIEASATADFAASTTLAAGIVTQDGSAEGAVEADGRMRLATDGEQFVRAAVTKVGASSCADQTVTFQLCF